MAIKHDDITDLVTPDSTGGNKVRPPRRSGWSPGKKWAAGIAIAAAAAGVGGAVAASGGGESDSAVRTERTTGSSTPSTSPSTTPETAAPVDKTPEIVLPVSNDPQTLVDQIFSNYTAAVTSNDPNFIDYIVMDSNSELGAGILSEMAEVDNFRKLRDKTYTSTFSGKVISSDFSNPEERKIVVESTRVNEGKYSDKVSGSQISQWTLEQKTVLVDQDGQGLQEQVIWAISRSESLGKPAQ